MRRNICCLFFICIFISTSCSFASDMTDISEIGVGAKALSLGRALVGLNGPGGSLVLNPASLAAVNNFQTSSMYTTLLSDIRYTLLTAASPYAMGTFGISWINSSIASIPLVRWTTVSGNLRPEQYATTDFGANVVLLSYSRDFKLFKLGTNLKFLTQSFSAGGVASLEGASGSGFDLDLGALFKPLPWASLGIAVQNVLPANLGGRFVWTRNSLEEAIPCVVRVGTAINILNKKDWTFTLDSEFNINKIRPGLLHAGLEWLPRDYLALRVGIDQQAAAATSSISIENNLTGGVGLIYQGFIFDYAYHQFGSLAENTTHFFSIGYVGR